MTVTAADLGLTSKFEPLYPATPNVPSLRSRGRGWPAGALQTMAGLRAVQSAQSVGSSSMLSWPEAKDGLVSSGAHGAMHGAGSDDDRPGLRPAVLGSLVQAKFTHGLARDLAQGPRDASLAARVTRPRQPVHVDKMAASADGYAKRLKNFAAASRPPALGPTRAQVLRAQRSSQRQAGEACAAGPVAEPLAEPVA